MEPENFRLDLSEDKRNTLAQIIKQNMEEINKKLLRDDLNFTQEMQTFASLYLISELAEKAGIDITPYHEERNKLLNEKCKYTQQLLSTQGEFPN